MLICENSSSFLSLIHINLQYALMSENVQNETIIAISGVLSKIWGMATLRILHLFTLKEFKILKRAIIMSL